MYREKVVQMFHHAYDHYLKSAFPYDELQPISCKGMDTWGSFSLTLIDALDTLAVMKNYTEFRRVVNTLLSTADFNVNINVSVFETNIRVRQCKLIKMTSKKKRLNLKEKIDVLKVIEKEKLSVRRLAERFHVGKTQISELLKDKEGIRKMWVLNSNENLKNLKFRKIETSEIDEVLMKWFRSARAKNIPVNGVLLQEKAREVGESLGLETFKASNGWLEKFRTRHNISFKQICGEEKSVNPNEVTDWFGKLKSLLKGYDDRDIFNADETDLFYRILPEKTLCLEGEKCSGGKISKEQLTLLLCCNMLEDFEIPVVIGKAKKPRCFKNIDVRKLSVSWKSNKKAWIITDIMSDWLVELDKKNEKTKEKNHSVHGAMLLPILMI
ncbi:Tigger transposable element-derived protein 4 [Araneus ventricosus]|uniref:alpha-1,2-Mannosidase n=1 Tax=Araneus ventricosus TaxID=182803 RepID=A0A4Y2J6L8_ARAVE|nr:Tigger transposable element-derived protein 4 [Araneus ventricosus]